MKYATLVLVALLAGCMNPGPVAQSQTAPAADAQPEPAVYVAQQQANWCWLAVAEMIGKAMTGLDVPQCEMAGDSCCNNDGSRCDHEGEVWNALAQNYGLKTSVVPFDAAALRVELAAGRPVGIDYFNTTKGHSVLLAAYEPVRGYQVMDPLVSSYWVADPSTSSWYGSAARMIIVQP